MVRDVSKYCGRCDTCQRGNHCLSKVKAELHPIPVTDVWKQIEIDLIGMLYMCMNNHVHRAPLGKKGKARIRKERTRKQTNMDIHKKGANTNSQAKT